MLIDFHTHCFPDDLAPRAMAKLAEEAGNHRAWTDGTVAGLKRLMDESGVDVSVMQAIATKPSQVKAIHDWQATVVDDRVKAFGTLHPDCTPAERKDALRQLVDQGTRGVKLHADYQGFFIDEDRALAMYEDLFAAGLCVLFHAGVDIGSPPPYHCTPDRLSLLLDRFPGGTFIAAHMGGYYYWDLVEHLLLGRDVYLDTCYALPHMGFERARRFIQRHGADKVLFGSDAPWGGQQEELAHLRRLGLDSQEEAAILGGNARRLLGIC